MTQIKDKYLSIAAPSEGLYKELGSRFIALAYPVSSETEIKEIVSSLKKKYHDARHHCYAFRLGVDGAEFRSSDDGEPAGTAGRPILGQIDSAGLSDVLVVVVRYFGGVKLGVPGLIRAYKTATADALAAAVKEEKTACVDYRLEFGYLSMNPVMKMIKDLSLAQRGQEFGNDCRTVVSVPLSKEEEFLKKVFDIEACSACKL